MEPTMINEIAALLEASSPYGLLVMAIYGLWMITKRKDAELKQLYERLLNLSEVQVSAISRVETALVELKRVIERITGFRRAIRLGVPLAIRFRPVANRTRVPRVQFPPANKEDIASGFGSIAATPLKGSPPTKAGIAQGIIHHTEFFPISLQTQIQSTIFLGRGLHSRLSAFCET